MNTTTLRGLGRRAGACRNDKAAYTPAIAAIDAEVAILKRSYPSMFWDENSPEYQAMSARWATERQERAEAVVA